MRRRVGRALAVPGVLAIAFASLASTACRRAPDRAVPEVTLHATVGSPPVEVLTAAALQRGLARVRLVDRIDEAEVLWAADPTEVLAVPDAVASGEAPDAPEVDARFRDPARRFAPVCARARVLVVNPRAALPFEPRDLRDLADPRVEGRIALPPADDPGHLTGLAVLASVYGEASAGRLVDLLARNRPRRGASDRDVIAIVARGDAALGLVGSEAGAAGAISAAALEVVHPDQSGRGAVVVPTAAALTRRGAASAPARALLAYLAGADAERLLVARVPGLMPLRPEVPLPPGVRPAGNVVSLPLDWDRIAAARKKLRDRLSR